MHILTHSKVMNTVSPGLLLLIYISVHINNARPQTVEVTITLSVTCILDTDMRTMALILRS